MSTKSKKLVLLVTILITIASMIAACGAPQTEPPAVTEEPTEVMTEAPTEAMTEAPTEAATEAATEALRAEAFACAPRTRTRNVLHR